MTAIYNTNADAKETASEYKINVNITNADARVTAEDNCYLMQGLLQ